MTASGDGTTLHRPTQAKGVLYFTRRAGLGDDVTVFWAAVAATLSQVIPTGIRLYFERPETRTFLAEISRLFPEIEVVEASEADRNVTYVRPDLAQVRFASPWSLIRKRLFTTTSFCDPYLHKLQTEYGHEGWRPTSSERFAVAIGLLRVWRPPYEPIYDGWQQLGIALGLSQKHAGRMEKRLSPMWHSIRGRLRPCSTANATYPSLLFPAGNSFQDFSDEFVHQIRDIVPGIQVARFRDDERPADFRFATVGEARDLIENAKSVITTDSLTSHLAQFFARSHILICTRARPGNACFPGALNTRIVDLGADLSCRPCAYLPLTQGSCAAGGSRCVAQRELPAGKLSDLLDVD